MNEFVHLHVHTDYSLLESCAQIKPLAEKVRELGMKSCAITDYGNLFGAVSFYSAMKAEGLKPIIGYEAFLTFGNMQEKTSQVAYGDKPYYTLVLLAKNLQGYKNLVYLSSVAYTQGLYFKPRIDLEVLSERSDGLIALTSGKRGFVFSDLLNGQFERTSQRIGMLRDIFGKENLYLEVQNHMNKWEEKLIQEIRNLAAKFDLGLVATNDVHYLNKEDAVSREVLRCIEEGTILDQTHTAELETDQYYLKSPDEMHRLFAEIPETLTNTLKIADKCNVELPSEFQLPLYPIPAEFASVDDYFEHVARNGFEKRLRAGELSSYPEEKYKERLRFEIDTIKRMGYSGYFLIVWDFVKFAKENNIPVGPGRGSAAGSLVAYCLEITNIDPLKYDLLFERFLNPERVSMPDIDIDFCVLGRASVIDYVTRKYGKDCVCQIITFGTLASKAAVKDVGRALGLKPSETEKISKLIPPPYRGRNTTIQKALEIVPELRELVEKNKTVYKIIDIAKRLEGCARHSSVHAAGVVISPKPLHEIIPIAIKEDDNKKELVSQYSMNDLEKVGMLKMDFLGLTTLTIIEDTLRLIKEKTGKEINWKEVPLDDEQTMRIFAEARTEAIFQFESEGMKQICRRLKPKTLEDLAALNALYRPGPLDGGMIDEFIERHHGNKKIDYIVPEMQDILSNTYGVLVYQEQIMMIAQKLAGYSLGEADMMRRAMGKKKKEEMLRHEEKFVKGAVQRGIAKDKAKQVFSLMAQFADYGFNRSHSVAYAYLSFQTAYLKAHYPAFFYAAVLSHESQNTDKIYKYSMEMQQSGLKLLPPDVNESDVDFTPVEGALRFGLSAIKGLGVSSAKAIITAREKKGKFSNFEDFLSSLNPSVINRRTLESLILAGALDSLRAEGVSVNLWRSQLYTNIDDILQLSQSIHKEKMHGQTNLFGGLAVSLPLKETSEWSDEQLAEGEKKSIGFYLSFHPLVKYMDSIEKLKAIRIADLSPTAGKIVTLAGIVTDPQVKYSKKGNRFCTFRLEDMSASVRCIVWSDAYSKYSSCFEDNQIIVVTGRIEVSDGDEVTITVERAKRLKQSLITTAKRLIVRLKSEKIDEIMVDTLLETLGSKIGECEVILDIDFSDDLSAQFSIDALRIIPSSIIEDKLKTMGCEVSWEY